MLILGLRGRGWPRALGPWSPSPAVLPSVTPALFPDICLCPENLGPCLFCVPQKRLCSHRSTCGETCPLWAGGGGVGWAVVWPVCIHTCGVVRRRSRLELWGWSARGRAGAALSDGWWCSSPSPHSLMPFDEQLQARAQPSRDESAVCSRLWPAVQRSGLQEACAWVPCAGPSLGAGSCLAGAMDASRPCCPAGPLAPCGWSPAWSLVGTCGSQ